MGILYTSIQLSGTSLPEVNFPTPGGSQGLLVTNNSVWDLTVFSPLWNLTIPSYSVGTMPASGNLQVTVKGLSKDTTLIALSNASVSWGSSNVSVPLNINPIASKAVVPVTITGGSITATIDTSGGPVDISGNTNSTVQNTQLGVGLDYEAQGTVSIPSGQTGTFTGSTIQVVPKGQAVTTSTLQVWTDSANGDLSDYGDSTLEFYYEFSDGTVKLVTSVTSTPDITPNFINLSSVASIIADTEGIPIQFNQIIVKQTINTALSATDTATIRIVIAGQAVPEISSESNPAYVTPSFEIPGSSTQTSMYNGVPLPVQISQWNATASEYVGSPANPRKAGQYNASVSANTTVSTSGELGTVTTLYRMTLVVIGASEGVYVKAHTNGAVIGTASNGNPLVVDWSDSGLDVSDTIDLENYTSNAGNVSFSVEYV